VIDDTVRRLDLFACIRRDICSTQNCQDRARVIIRYVRYGPSDQSSFCFRHTLGQIDVAKAREIPAFDMRTAKPKSLKIKATGYKRRNVPLEC
jgi:hypothetical protein